jgi:CO dehydrogenase/acetyl-CoA synthase beta subunit
MGDEKDIAKILKDALTIVDKLATLDITDKDDHEELEELIEKAQKLSKNRLWKLK